MADRIPEFQYTLYPDGRVRTLIVDGTHWVTVAEAGGMVSRARAEERERATPAVRDALYAKDERIADLLLELDELRERIAQEIERHDVFVCDPLGAPCSCAAAARIARGVDQ